tara:strand:+ start:497 stop:979 length:483 start_codon:yes stop_codon:yes gene_type:complete
MSCETPIEDYLMTFKQLSSGTQEKYYERMLRHGKTYAGAEEDFNYENYQTTIKACFSNSLNAWMMEEDFDYVEGYYYTKGIPIAMEHAWNVCKKTGKVYDFTSVPNNIPVIQRFGVVVSNTLLRGFLECDLVGVLTPLQWALRYRKGIYKQMTLKKKFDV